MWWRVNHGIIPSHIFTYWWWQKRLKRTHWKQCPLLCQARMKKEQLANEEDLGFTSLKRISDNILHAVRQERVADRLPWAWPIAVFCPDNSYHSWLAGIWTGCTLKASICGRRGIALSPWLQHTHRILIPSSSGPQWFEPVTYFWALLPERCVLTTNRRVQKDWKQEYASLLMGGLQGSMWTEFYYCSRDIDYSLFPIPACSGRNRHWTL